MLCFTPGVDEPVALRILFADDDEAFRHLLRVRLDQIPEVEIVAEAADGAEAVELALALRPEFVLLDIAMPRLDGFEAATRIQESLPQATVVMHSGEMTPHNVSRCADLELPLRDKLRLDETLLEIVRVQAKPSSRDERRSERASGAVA